ncbi:hypothetical protein LJC23_03650 [Desulfovibrio sp. OttesenSCG-928-I05]|nr:hypothetical protein [Desulfovibrio sp. OttesenSCG-928-I05]
MRMEKTRTNVPSGGIAEEGLRSRLSRDRECCELSVLPGTVIPGGSYSVSSDREYAPGATGASGLRIAPGATVELYIAPGVTLSCLGREGGGDAGGGAGIRLPGSSTLIVRGPGRLVAHGGDCIVRRPERSGGIFFRRRKNPGRLPGSGIGGDGNDRARGVKQGKLYLLDGVTVTAFDGVAHADECSGLAHSVSAPTVERRRWQSPFCVLFGFVAVLLAL